MADQNTRLPTHRLGLAHVRGIEAPERWSRRAHLKARLLVTLATMLVLGGASPRSDASSLDPGTWRGDARFLVAAIDSIHPRPYRVHGRAAWDSAAADLERRLPTLRYDQAVGAFSGLIGLLGDGHSRLGHLALASHTRPTLTPLPGPGFDVSYPVECGVFSDGLWVVRATPAHAGLLGSHVVAIDGQTVSRAVASLEPLIPTDNAVWPLHLLPAFLRVPGYLAAVGLSREPAAPLRLTVVDARGKRRDAIIPADHNDSTATWPSADAETRTPLPLTRSLPGPFQFADWDDSTVFARVREITDPPDHETLAQFADRLFAHVDSAGARRLILDVRGNGGGNNYLNQPLVHGIIRRPVLDRDGGLFVIIDRGSFSAAVSLTADLERETHAVFVGEPTGGAPNSYGDPTRVTLPGSGLVVRISTLYWQGSDPRDPRGFIAPDLPASPSWSDWVSHRDPAEKAIREYRPGRPTGVPPNTHWQSDFQIGAKPLRIIW